MDLIGVLTLFIPKYQFVTKRVAKVSLIHGIHYHQILDPSAVLALVHGLAFSSKMPYYRPKVLPLHTQSVFTFRCKPTE